MPLEVGDPVNFFSGGNSESGVIAGVTGANDYTVQVQNPDDSTRCEESVGELGQPGTDPDRYIERRDGANIPGPGEEGGEL